MAGTPEAPDMARTIGKIPTFRMHHNGCDQIVVMTPDDKFWGIDMTFIDPLVQQVPGDSQASARARVSEYSYHANATTAFGCGFPTFGVHEHTPFVQSVDGWLSRYLRTHGAFAITARRDSTHCITNMLVHIPIDVPRHAMWTHMNRATIGRRMVIPADQFIIDELTEIDPAYMDAFYTGVAPGFNPLDYNATEMHYVTDIATAMAIAGVKLASRDKAIKADDASHNLTVYNIGLGKRPVECYAGKPVAKWFHLEDDTANSILDLLIQSAMDKGKDNFVATVPMRGVCKAWQTRVDDAFKQAATITVDAMLKAHASKLIADWLDVRSKCLAYGIAPWDVWAELKHKMSPWHVYARLKTQKRPSALPK